MEFSPDADSTVLFDPGAKYIHLSNDHFNALREVLNQRILERLRAAQFTIETGYTPCSKSTFGTDTYCKLPGSCHYMRDKGLQLEFKLTVFDGDASSSKSASNKFTIELSGDDMLVEGTAIDPQRGSNSCYIPIMK